MRIVHICDGWGRANGAANIARLLAGEQQDAGHEVVLRRWVSPRALRAADEVWIHCGWKPCLWWAAFWARRAVWVPEACYDPIRLRFHGWKKSLAGPIERFALRRCAAIVATCPAEKTWVESYLGTEAPPVEVTDIRRFFPTPTSPASAAEPHEGLRVLYMGRRHPLKGVGFLETAVAELRAAGVPVELRLVSNAFGAEKERAFAWCDVLCLPTLSDNLGLVVAEALAHGRPVITTDGAPAWADEPRRDAEGRARLAYLEGYRDAPPETRVRLLSDALRRFVRRA